MKKPLLLLVVSLTVPQLLPAADLLVAGFTADKVIRYDGTTGALIGIFAEHATLMNGPAALAYNAAGELLVLNEFSHNVLRFDGTTGAYLGVLIDSSSLGAVGAADPDDMEVGADGQLYITSHFSTGGAIWRFNSADGSYLGVFATNSLIHHTHGLTRGPDGNWYQGDLDMHSIERYDGVTGAHMGTFASHADLFPGADLTFGLDGKLYATMDGTSGVMRFDATSGAFIDYLIAPGTSAWAAQVEGTSLYIGVTSTGTIKKYDATTGAFVSDFITGTDTPFDVIAMAVPEPGAVALGAAGMLAVMFAIRRGRVA